MMYHSMKRLGVSALTVAFVLKLSVGNAAGAAFRLSFLDNRAVLEDSCQLLRQSGFSEEAARTFKVMVEHHNKLGNRVDRTKFPEAVSGYYQFQSLADLTNRLPGIFAEVPANRSPDQNTLMCFDVACLLLRDAGCQAPRFDQDFESKGIVLLSADGSTKTVGYDAFRSGQHLLYPENGYRHFVGKPRSEAETRLGLSLRAARHLAKGDLNRREGLEVAFAEYVAALKRDGFHFPQGCRLGLGLYVDPKARCIALGISVAELFSAGTVPVGNMAAWEPAYRMNDDFSINRGFEVSGEDVRLSAINTAKQLRLLPFSLYHSIDLKTLSSIVGAIFAGCLASEVDAIVNPIEKGHPDIIPPSGRTATEAQLRNYPEGLEIKVTVGNVAKGSNLQPGTPRIAALTGITWQAHHREVERLLGLSIDFAGATHDGKRYPMITGAFFTDELAVGDWGEISGTTGRNTKVTGMRSSGKSKMGNGWVLLIEDDTYITKYSELLNFTTD